MKVLNCPIFAFHPNTHHEQNFLAIEVKAMEEDSNAQTAEFWGKCGEGGGGGGGEGGGGGGWKGGGGGGRGGEGEGGRDGEEEEDDSNTQEGWNF